LRDLNRAEEPLAAATQDFAADGCEHAVQFYESDTALAAAVCEHVGPSLSRGEAVVVIATGPHRDLFEAGLVRDGLDLTAARARDAFVSLDAAELMEAFIVRGEIDATGFREVMGGLMRAAGAAERRVHVYGEMVALLWDEGNVLGAIELEGLWNELGRELPFSLLCGYRAASVAGEENLEALQRICHLHSSVREPPPSAAAGAAPPPTELAGEFPRSRDAPRMARHELAHSLERAGHNATFIANASLVLTELATNAVLHARSPFSLAVTSDASTLRIAVEDQAPLEEHGPASGSGLVARSSHGLGLIDAICTRWGVERTSGGKVVWAELRA
jgi:anti-sigma regulatory factor (Ser/Thr protein kinase)